ncbi:MAG: Diguanylate cyclase/phosphodiesterase (GGDEF & EAL domains) with PAS/PAC sensor(S) [uncultured Sulfurovum sp.]|uniref:Diguanylate cyclase/phosphodiesterase (GGDEF & EAL domains) with PAS/PAC sensor(S) n=1 Tax=uncultured Sulfurovum sp. TaxID=269237 RepID=A0A6S6SFV8_9BACT|nr:MAG: Diguanylate cyclase/phosphodiesterase (GGDEF & EAL domains) with PAS/PAC sensor(S) [uncultured Sulfurovum sp.]
MKMKENNFSILYVEDEIETQEAIQSILETYFKKVFVANNGEEGLSIYNQESPDIVISDISMPVMDGLVMAEEIKKIKSTQVLALFTAFNDPAYLKKAAQLNIDTYMMKPLNREQFFNSLSFLVLTLEMENEGVANE